MKVEYTRFERLVTDQCMFRYKDVRGREMIFASYVDDIICCTTDLELRERFFDHLRKTWGITHEGTLDMFLGIHFERSQDKWSWSATMGTYIDKIVKRFGLEESRKSRRQWSRVLRSRLRTLRKSRRVHEYGNGELDWKYRILCYSSAVRYQPRSQCA